MPQCGPTRPALAAGFHTIDADGLERWGVDDTGTCGANCGADAGATFGIYVSTEDSFFGRL